MTDEGPTIVKQLLDFEFENLRICIYVGMNETFIQSKQAIHVDFGFFFHTSHPWSEVAITQFRIRQN
jgi:hypothetical protein